MPPISPPSISVVAPIRDNHHLTRSCLESVARAAQGMAVEVLVVDDGSQGRRARALMRPLTSSWGRIAYDRETTSYRDALRVVAAYEPASARPPVRSLEAPPAASGAASGSGAALRELVERGRHLDEPRRSKAARSVP
jgi:hypothetical protein